MKEDENLKQKFGTNNGFKVPEGYFESLTPTIMRKLPMEETVPPVHVTLWDKVKPWIYMAAMFCGLLFTIRAVVGHDSIEDIEELRSEEYSELPDEYIDPVIDKIMVDDYTLYVYLSESDAGIY